MINKYYLKFQEFSKVFKKLCFPDIYYLKFSKISSPKIAIPEFGILNRKNHESREFTKYQENNKKLQLKNNLEQITRK